MAFELQLKVPYAKETKYIFIDLQLKLTRKSYIFLEDNS